MLELWLTISVSGAVVAARNGRVAELAMVVTDTGSSLFASEFLLN